MGMSEFHMTVLGTTSPSYVGRVRIPGSRNMGFLLPNSPQGPVTTAVSGARLLFVVVANQMCT